MATAKADCTWANGASPQDYLFYIATLFVPRDAAVGTVIYTAPVQTAIPAQGSYANCSGSVPAVRKVTGGAQVSANPYTFATNVAGIGMRFFDRDASGTTRYWGAGAQESYNGPWAWNGATLGVQVVVTGQVARGTTNGALLATMTLGSLTIANLHVGTANVVPTTCNVTATQTVSLPTISRSGLPSVGSTGGSTPFTITLGGCPAGMNQVQYQFDPPDGALNAALGTFALSHDSTAQGVALSLTDAMQAPVSLGTPHTVSAYNPASGGTYPINFAIRYYRTGTVTPGKVNGSLIFTMFYQ
ncbi:MAG TPA: fimbrial protein [Paraburkholderia sp.]